MIWDLEKGNAASENGHKYWSKENEPWIFEYRWWEGKASWKMEHHFKNDSNQSAFMAFRSFEKYQWSVEVSINDNHIDHSTSSDQPIFAGLSMASDQSTDVDQPTAFLILMVCDNPTITSVQPMIVDPATTSNQSDHLFLSLKNVCVNPTPHHKQDVTQGQFLSWNSEFSFF